MLELMAAHSSLAGKLALFWCNVMHDAAMWPIHGRYQCRSCGRSYLVPWAAKNLAQPQPLAELNQVTSGA
jgi:hypothetical protein